jgi:hypothetical protein
MAQAEPGVRGQKVTLGPLTGAIYVYATFEVLPENPVSCTGAAPEQGKHERTEAAFVMSES